MDVSIVGQCPEIELKRFRSLKKRSRKKRGKAATSRRVIVAVGLFRKSTRWNAKLDAIYVHLEWCSRMVGGHQLLSCLVKCKFAVFCPEARTAN